MTRFWDKIRAGAEQAAKDTGSKLQYSNDPAADKQAQLIQTAVDSKVDGIATTLVTPDALAGAVKSATDAGIPLVGFNSGIDQYKELGALMYFGSDENLAGADGRREDRRRRRQEAAVCHPGRRLGGAGGPVRRRQERRCRRTENIQVNGADDSAVVSSLQAKLSQDKSIDYIVTLGAPIALDAMKAHGAVVAARRSWSPST